MNIEEKELMEHIYDTDLVKEALYYIENGFIMRHAEKQMSRGIISKIAYSAKQVVDTLKEQPTIVKTYVKNTEEEAREYFGDDFIAKFEEIRKKISEHDATLWIHGTAIENANSIMKNGLEARQRSIQSTAVYQTSYEDAQEYNEFSKIMNWPHYNYKGLVLIAIPNECTIRQDNAKPIWEYKPIEGENEKTTSTREYAIKPEYIVAVIDVEERKITENPAYTNQHSYEGLFLDDLIFGSIIQPEEQSEVEATESEIHVKNESADDQNIKLIEAEASDLIMKIYEIYNWILLVEERDIQIIGEDGNILGYGQVPGTQEKEILLQCINRLMEIIPALREVEFDDKEIEDFISTVRVSGISKITDKLWRYQENIEKNQKNDWGDEGIFDGAGTDGWISFD